MPIGNIDYISTAAWNSTTNPWPQYAQVALSAADTNLNVSGAPLIMQLTLIDPTAGELNWTYESLNHVGPSILMNCNSPQVDIRDGNGDIFYATSTIVRAVPAGWKQGNTTWDVVDIGEDVTSLSIVPDVTQLTPWEFRRRRMLEMI